MTTKKKVKNKKYRELTILEKSGIWTEMEWEGGLIGYLEHGGLEEAVRGTTLWDVVNALKIALKNAEEAFEAEGIDESCVIDEEDENE